MRIEFTATASQHLDDAYQYYAEAAGETIAARIVSSILDATDVLLAFPMIGQQEELLKHLGKNHRRLVEGNYKIIYRIEGDTIYISDVFDARQNPFKMKG